MAKSSNRRSIRTTTDPKAIATRSAPVRLTAEQIALFDRLQREEKLARKYRKHATHARKLREQLDALFGTARSALFLADDPSESRGLLRSVEIREYDPLPAKTVEIVKYLEFPMWDLE